MSSTFQLPKKCECCNKVFIAKTTKTRYCSSKCNSKHYKQLKREEKINASMKQDFAEVQSQQSLQSGVNNNLASKDYLSVKEACQLLGASRWTIYRLISSETIKSAKLGRKTIIPKVEIQNLFN